MKRKRIYNLLLILFVVVMLTISLGACDNSTGNNNETEESTTADTEVDSSSGSPQESIEVHGHWILEVRNPDGSLVERREFENALTASGANVLIKVLSREKTIGGWMIQVSGSPQPLVPNTIVEASYPFPAGATTLTVTASPPGPIADKLVLTGTAVATADGYIAQVYTQVGLLPEAAPWDTYGNIWGFTEFNLASPVELSTGQHVLITVEITFS